MKKRDRDILLLVLAVVLVAMLWGPIWFLAKLIGFIVVVFIVYQLLKGKF